MTTQEKARIKAVIFDMDNTLFDFVEAKLKACKAVVRMIGENDEFELIEYFLTGTGGFEDKKRIADYLHNKGKYTDELYHQCCLRYEDVKLRNIVRYPGIRETLGRLREQKLKLAVVTDASRTDAIARLRKTDLLLFFDYIIPAELSGKRKPAPDSFALALEKLGVAAREAVLVGDSLARDIVPGKKLGLVTVHAAYGDRNFRENKSVRADFRVESPGELVGVVEGAEGSEASEDEG